MFTLSSFFSCSVLWKPMWQFEYGLRILMLVIFVDNPVIIMLWMKIWVWISRKVPWALCCHPTVETLHSFFQITRYKTVSLKDSWKLLLNLIFLHIRCLYENVHASPFMLCATWSHELPRSLDWYNVLGTAMQGPSHDCTCNGGMLTRGATGNANVLYKYKIRLAIL